jgi:DNA polymerase III delta subunit
MLYLFVGDDVIKAKAEAIKRAKGREVVRFGEGGEPFANVGGYLEQQGMFAPALALILDRPLDSADGKELLAENAELLSKASALVFAIVPDIDAATKKKLDKYADVEEFETKHVAEMPPPNSFALTDAVQAGDKKRAWILYRQLIASGASAEELHGVLAWAARGVVLASKTKSATEAGMKSYPYDKARAVARRLKPGEAEQQSAELVSLYHQARMGRGTLEDLLEIYLLNTK